MGVLDDDELDIRPKLPAQKMAQEVRQGMHAPLTPVLYNNKAEDRKLINRKNHLAVEINNPEAPDQRRFIGERAAANPPAATNAITQAGKLAISGLAKTIISLSIINSLFS